MALPFIDSATVIDNNVIKTRFERGKGMGIVDIIITDHLPFLYSFRFLVLSSLRSTSLVDKVILILTPSLHHTLTPRWRYRSLNVTS